MIEERRRGVIIIHADSIIKALYGDGYRAVAVKANKDDRLMLEITVSHPALPEWKNGTQIKRIEIKRTYETQG